MGYQSVERVRRQPSEAAEHGGDAAVTSVAVGDLDPRDRFEIDSRAVACSDVNHGILKEIFRCVTLGSR